MTGGPYRDRESRELEPERVHSDTASNAEVTLIGSLIVEAIVVLLAPFFLHQVAEEGSRGAAAVLGWLLAILLACALAHQWAWRTIQRWRRENPR